MEAYRATLRPRSAFGSAFFGDTLFGQLCWSLRHRLGEPRLEELLQGYRQGQPFLVASDAFPAGHVPRPALPSSWFLPVPDTLRKAMKKRRWLPLAAIEKPLAEWQNACVDDQQAGLAITRRLQPHNSIDRRTGTTNDSGFAPYGMGQTWYAEDTRLDVYLLLDTQRLSAQVLQAALAAVGEWGYGRDASIGLGKFELQAFEPVCLPAQSGANACLTLAPCAPQGLGLEPTRSFYRLFTRFGRHGDVAVHRSGQPFKNPVLLAHAGAVLAAMPPADGFIGQGLGGLSKAIENTVQQGYAPVIGVHLPKEQNA